MGELEYICPLTKEAIKIAKEELREDDDIRKQALEMMRNWIINNPRILSCRMDASFLLRFLRFKKFSIPMAQETMERYILLRQCYELGFRKLDMRLPAMQELLMKGYLFAVPKRDSHGRRIIIARPGQFDPHKYINADMCRIHGIVYETLMEDEENQVKGFVHFNDGVGVSFPHLTLFTPKEAVRITKNGERTLPMRHKEVHVINVHPSVKYALDFGMRLISDKIKKRVKIHSDIGEVHKYVDKTLLPKEYGGDMPMSEMIDLFMKELETSHPRLLANDEDLKVHAEMYSESARVGAVSALRNGGSCGPHNDILTGSFRKLQVD
ncbi:alpha-tocopherol transfer protein-like [Lycorma delicatula]|uniref:alpha-tocopherol transfer protein-like n=1 Tax=Lycorma delicatula TaxID=130591 RepID=UPI003F512956